MEFQQPDESVEIPPVCDRTWEGWKELQKTESISSCSTKERSGLSTLGLKGIRRLNSASAMDSDSCLIEAGSYVFESILLSPTYTVAFRIRLTQGPFSHTL